MVHKTNVKLLIKALKKAKAEGKEYDQNDVCKCSLHYMEDAGIKEPKKLTASHIADYEQTLFGLTKKQFYKVFWLAYKKDGSYEPRSFDKQIKILENLLK